jgi:hypothetical protein
MLQLIQGGGISTPSQDRQYTTHNSRFTIWNARKKSENLAVIGQSQSTAIQADVAARRDVMNLMMDMTLAGDRMYQVKYQLDHERKMWDKEEQMADAQIERVKQETEKLKRETMLVEVKIESGMQDLKSQKLEDRLKELSINKRIESGDY